MEGTNPYRLKLLEQGTIIESVISLPYVFLSLFLLHGHSTLREIK